MRLGDVLNKIFRKRQSDKLANRNKKPAEDIYKPIEHKIEDDSRFQKISEHINAEQGSRQTTESERLDKRNKFLIIGVGLVVVLTIISLVSVIYVRISDSAFKEDKVNITINGPEDVLIGEEAEYEIVVTNKNKVKLKNVIIGLNFPDNLSLREMPFIVSRNLSGARINVGEIKNKSQKKYKVKILSGYSNNTELLLKAFVRYEPSNVSSSFQTDFLKNIHLVRSGISASILATENISSGEMIDLKIGIKNNDSKEYDKLLLKVEYPDGFSFNNSTIESINENHNSWVIEQLQPGEQKEIKISGKLVGKIDSIKKFKITITKDGNTQNIIHEGENNIKIIPSKIILEQKSDEDTVYPGELVHYKITFKNNSTVVLRNLILKVHLPGKFIKRDTIEHEGGYYDNEENVIIWKASDVEKLKKLQPGEEGSVNFSVQVQSIILPEEGKNKNPYIRIYSEIESLDVDSPVFENKKIISNSMVQINSSITYLPEDNNGEEEAYLTVGKKIFLRVRLAIKNTTNDLNDVKVSASFPSGISMEKRIYPKKEDLKLHSRSNQLEWNIGSMEAGTGIITPQEKAEIIISIIPSINQVGREIDLINNIQKRILNIKVRLLNQVPLKELKIPWSYQNERQQAN